MIEFYFRLIMVLNCLDIVNCWIFFGVVFIFLYFIGFCFMMKNFICLLKFWILLFVFVFFVIGDVIESISFLIVVFVYKFRVMVVVCFMFFLNVFFVIMIFGVLNEMKICYMVLG